MDPDVIKFLTQSIVASVTDIVNTFVDDVEAAVTETELTIGWALQYRGLSGWSNVLALDAHLPLGEADEAELELEVLAISSVLDTVLRLLGTSVNDPTSGLLQALVRATDSVFDTGITFKGAANTLISGLKPLATPVLGVVDNVLSLEANTQQVGNVSQPFPAVAATDVEYL